MFKNKPLPLKLLAGLFIVICALLPVHAFISTWAISTFGHELIFKSWKELLLIAAMVPLACVVLWRNRESQKPLLSSTLNQLVIGFIVLNIILAILMTTGTKSSVAGLIFNTRYFIFFLAAQVIALQYKKPVFQEYILRVLFWGGVVVVAFGALQVLVLPADFLRHFGYQKSIIPPYFTVDNNQQLVRIIATLRGPNALGAYLVFWLPILALVTKRMWNVAAKYRYIAAVIWTISLITLYGSRSRSGYIGAIIALGIVTALQLPSQWQKRFFAGAGVFTVAIITMLSLQWNSRFVQITLLHNDPTESNSVNSDQQHASSIREALTTITHHPFGLGPGSTNIASTYGATPRTVENYYLAVAEELGIVGLILFLAILVLTAVKLWQLRANDIAAALFASFVGLLVINLLLPVWSDETLSMLWWGMAGIVLATPLAKLKKRATV